MPGAVARLHTLPQGEPEVLLKKFAPDVTPILMFSSNEPLVFDQLF